MPITARGGRTRQESQSSVGSWTVLESANSNHSNGGAASNNDDDTDTKDKPKASVNSSETIKSFSLLPDAVDVPKENAQQPPAEESAPKEVENGENGTASRLNEDDSRKSRTEYLESSDGATNGYSSTE